MTAPIVKDEANVERAYEIMQDLSLSEEETMAQLEELRKEDPGAVDVAVGDIFSLAVVGLPLAGEESSSAS